MMMASSQAPQRGLATMWIALAGAVAYNSWPLAFLMNPWLAGSALASSFESRGEPYSWLFILLDCVSGVCAVVVCARELWPRPGRPRPGRASAAALLGYGVFGLATAVDAVVPLTCATKSAQACASQLWPLTPDDWLTGIAMFGLFLAAVLVAARIARRPLGLPPAGPAITAVALAGWSGLGLVILVGVSATTAAVCQYVFLTLTSILAFVVPVSASSAGDVKRSAARGQPLAGDDGAAPSSPARARDRARTR